MLLRACALATHSIGTTPPGRPAPRSRTPHISGRPQTQVLVRRGAVLKQQRYLHGSLGGELCVHGALLSWPACGAPTKPHPRCPCRPQTRPAPTLYRSRRTSPACRTRVSPTWAWVSASAAASAGSSCCSVAAAGTALCEASCATPSRRGRSSGATTGVIPGARLAWATTARLQAGLTAAGSRDSTRRLPSPFPPPRRSLLQAPAAGRV